MADGDDPGRSWADEVNEALTSTTQAELGRRLGVDAQTVHRWSKGQNPRASVLPRLRDLLHRLPTGFEAQGPSVDQWMLDSKALFQRYTDATEIWIIKTGKGLISQEDGEAKATLARIVVANLKAHRADKAATVKTVNFLAASEDTAKHVTRILDLVWEELRDEKKSPMLEQLGFTKGGTPELRKLQSLAIGAMMPDELQLSLTFEAAESVRTTLDDYILKSTDEDDDTVLKEWVRKTIKVYPFDNLFELWAMGLGFNDTGLIYLKYDAAPTPHVSNLRTEVLWEIDVREASTLPNGMIQSNPRSIWIRPRDQHIVSQAKRIKRVIDAIVERAKSTQEALNV